MPAATIVATGYEPSGRDLWERSGVTGDDGDFRMCVPYSEAIEVEGGHPEVGLQWTSGAWGGYRYYGPLPGHSIRLELRRGAVLRGRLLDPDGQTLADHVVVLFPPLIVQACMTSVCTQVRTVTDVNGEFRFERMLLSPDMRLAWSRPDLPPYSTGRIERTMAAHVLAAENDQPVDLVIGSWRESEDELVEGSNQGPDD